MGNDDGAEVQQVGTAGMVRKRTSSAMPVDEKATRRTISSSSLEGTALGRRLGATAAAADVEASDGAEESKSSRSVAVEGVQGLRTTGTVFGEQEIDLLQQPLIHVTGGLSGLGVSQLSDNDKFSCIVKYLLDFDRFKEVTSFYSFSLSLLIISYNFKLGRGKIARHARFLNPETRVC